MSEGKKSTKKGSYQDRRFQTKNDPRYLPIDARVPLNPQFAEMFDDSFPILRTYLIINN
jgi:hypothetical protein